MAQVALVIATAAYTAYAQNKASQAQKRIANRNADLMEQQAEDARKQGEEEAAAIRRRVRRLQGQQKAAFATQGLETGSGTAADLIEETAALGAEDQLRIRNNAAMSAWGFRTQAANTRYEGRQLRRQGQQQAASSLISGLGSGYREYSAWQQSRVPNS